MKEGEWENKLVADVTDELPLCPSELLPQLWREKVKGHH